LRKADTSAHKPGRLLIADEKTADRHLDLIGQISLQKLGMDPALAAVLLGGMIVLAVQHYGLLLGVTAGSPAAWALPGSYAGVAAGGLAWGLILKVRRSHVYAAIGLGAYAATARHDTAGDQ
jgi:hypothetical protein